MRTEVERYVERILVEIPRCEPIPKNVTESIQDITLDEIESLLRTIEYMAYKCEAWTKQWKELHSLVQTHSKLRRVK
ncbi:hypothetical protein ABES02_29185 [Neobacillus pocheonensis]|uniref:hypothetical protein n=1 Tax=Neobacillus pocheonensis TaxID=363869 RepID=UPI003D2CBDA4